MNLVRPPAQTKAAMTYNAAADHYDKAPLAFWDRHGLGTVRRLQLQPGNTVLDVGCGAGASAIPAAVAVGPGGTVTGIDVAENMLLCARGKARAHGLDNLHFKRADMSASGFPGGRFDAVICVFAVFFATDMERQIAELWRMLRPGGKLAVTVWGPHAFQPGAKLFSEAVTALRPDIVVPRRPWERLTHADNFRRLLLDGGTTEPAIETVNDSQPLTQPDDFWTIALGSGFRWEIDQLTIGEQESVRAEVARRLAAMGANTIETGAIYAVASKPR